MICGTWTQKGVTKDELADKLAEAQLTDPQPASVSSAPDPDAKGTFIITAVYPPCPPNVSHDPAGAAGAVAAAGAAGAAAQLAVGPAAPTAQALAAPAPLVPPVAVPPAQAQQVAAAVGALKGFDADFDCSHLLGKAKAVGTKFVGRYYSHSPNKNLSPSEARLISAAGMGVVTVWETRGDHYSFFSFKQGADGATSASNQAQTIGQPIDSAIYFAVDYDASPEEIAGGITDYFKGVQQGLAASMPGKATYAAGVYGSGLTCDTLFKAGLVQHTWLAMSTGYRGSKTYSAWNIRQSVNEDLLGIGKDKEVDPDVSNNAANGGLGAFTIAMGGIPGNF